MNKGKKFLIILALLLFLIGCGKKESKEEKKPENIKYEKSSINIVTSLEDELKDNSVWCGTFNLAWNILKDEYVGGDVVVNTPNIQIDNLNNSKFNKNYLSEKSYYVNYGRQTPDLKKQIENDIKKKFNQTSDILNSFTWQEDTTNDFMYAMLYKNFKFENKFKKVKNTTFNDTGDYEYFGINNENNSKNQVKVLFYNSNKNNAIKINTKEDDEIILVKGIEQKSLYDIYNSLLEHEKSFDGNKNLTVNDSLLIPIINFNTFEEFSNIENIPFKYKNGEERVIDKAVQTIQLKIDEEGGEIKSEAGISTTKGAEIMPKETRTFNYNTSFVLFLKEKDSNLPYFAAYITDLNDFQK